MAVSLFMSLYYKRCCGERAEAHFHYLHTEELCLKYILYKQQIIEYFASTYRLLNCIVLLT